MFCSEKEMNKKGTAVALGYFDGIHIGHRAVLLKALEKAKQEGLIPVVTLFDVHPRKVIGGRVPPVLTDEEKKRKILEDMGFEVFDFNFRDAMNYSPNEFIEKILIEKLDARFVSCGYDYHYGKGGKGDAQSLHDELEKRGIDSFSLLPVSLEGEIVSSTKIRDLIQGGEIEKANRMLGGSFSYCLPVERGDGRGKGFGFPTINQFFEEDFIVPLFGVYASAVTVEGKTYPAVTNIGVRPTVGTDSMRSETCILGFEGNLYGERIEVSLLSFLRGEVKFSSFDELKKQIAKDAEEAEKIYNEVMKNG